MKKVLSLALAFLMVLCLGIPAFAAEDSSAVLDGISIEENGLKREISYTEYKELLSITDPIGITYTFDEATNKGYHYWGDPVYVSSVGSPGGTIFATISQQVTAEFSANLDYAAELEVLSGLSFSCGLTLTSSTGTSSGYFYTLPSNLYGRVTWSASMRHIEGTLTTNMLLNTGATVSVPQYITAEIPQKIVGGPADGMADGLFDHITSTNKNDLI